MNKWAIAVSIGIVVFGACATKVIGKIVEKEEGSVVADVFAKRWQDDYKATVLKVAKGEQHV